MESPKRRPTTVYLEPRLARAVKIKAALTDQSISDIVNQALSDRLREEHEHLRIIRQRRHEPTRSWEDVLKDLKRDGLI